MHNKSVKPFATRPGRYAATTTSAPPPPGQDGHHSPVDTLTDTSLWIATGTQAQHHHPPPRLVNTGWGIFFCWLRAADGSGDGLGPRYDLTHT